LREEAVVIVEITAIDNMRKGMGICPKVWVTWLLANLV
jgi:hypothetical protein